VIVTGSAGDQPASFIAAAISCMSPTKPTFSGSPGIPSPVCVTIGFDAKPVWCS
jgi:hypothetical protein